MIKNYKAGEILFHEQDSLKLIGLVKKGLLIIESSTIDGFSFEIQRIRENEFFGDSLVYTDSFILPGTITAKADSTIEFYTKDEFLNLIKGDSLFLNLYLMYSSKRNINQQYKIKLLGQPSIREKILFYIKSEMIKQKSNPIKINSTKEELSVLLGLNRPSLSRELMRMRDDGLIEYNRFEIKYLKKEGV